MTGSWKFVSETWETISLHDHCITSVEEIGTDLILHFTDDGFDVTKDTPLNPTGRHRNTGPAALILKNWCWKEGAFGSNCFQVISLDNGQKEYIPLPVVLITREQFLRDLELEVLAFTWEREKSLVTLEGNGYMDPPLSGSEDGFVTVLLSCNRLLFCWNDLPRDAWFQEQPKK